MGVKLKYPVLCWHGLGKESEMQMRWTCSFQLTLQRENNHPRSGSFPEKHCFKTISTYKSRLQVTHFWNEQPTRGQVCGGVGCQLAPLLALFPIPSLEVHISSTASNLIQTRSSRTFKTSCFYINKRHYTHKKWSGTWIKHNLWRASKHPQILTAAISR